MRKTILSALLITLIGNNSLAQVPLPDKEELYKAVQERMPYSPEDLFSISDVDGNQKLSRNEINEMSKGSALTPSLTAEEKENLANKINAAFDTFDKNKDEFLDKEESSEYFQQILKEIIETVVENQSKFFKSLENKSPEEILAAFNEKQKEMMTDLEKATKKLNASANLNNLSVDNLLINQTRQSAGEEFFQGDTNKDGKLDKQEFIAYQKLRNDDSYIQQYTTQKYENDFNEMDLTQKGYITKEEYVKYELPIKQKMLEEMSANEKKYIEEKFRNNDINQDKKLDKQEFISYMKQLAEKFPSPETSDQNFDKYFDKIDSAKKGYLTKEEYIVMHTMDRQITPQEIEEEFAEIDANQDGKLDKQEYIAYQKKGDEELSDSLADSYEDDFNEIDTDKKGYLTKEEYIEFQVRETQNILKI